jgi:hypothetical protein
MQGIFQPLTGCPCFLASLLLCFLFFVSKKAGFSAQFVHNGNIGKTVGRLYSHSFDSAQDGEPVEPKGTKTQRKNTRKREYFMLEF